MARSARRRAHDERYDPMPEPEPEPGSTLPPRQDCHHRELPRGSRHLGDELWETPDGRMFYVTG